MHHDLQPWRAESTGYVRYETGRARFGSQPLSTDFIQRYIFPGSCIPSVSVLSNAVARASDLRIVHLEDIGPHYATTLQHWRERLYANVDAVRQLGVSEEFLRMWEFYLCYCEAGFLERDCTVNHISLVGRDWRPDLATVPTIAR